MMIGRRALGAGIGALAFAACTTASSANAPDPLLRLATRGRSKVYLFGFADAPDEGWLTPKIARAMDETTELWTETPPPDTGAPPIGANSPVIAELGYDRSRDLIGVLPPDLAKRVLAYAEKLNITRERLAPMKPWLAREAIQRAWVASQGAPADALTAQPLPDVAIVARMRQRNVPIRSEYASIDDVLRAFATMSQQAQIEYLTNLLDYFDGDQSGANADKYDWIYGRPSERYILEQKAKTPALYDAMHTQRNTWWAEKIDSLLGRPSGVCFVLAGQNHVNGPDSIQICCERRGIAFRLI